MEATTTISEQVQTPELQQTVNDNGNTVITVPPGYKFAGKYNTLEDVISSLKSAGGMFDKNRQLEEQLASYKVPDDYQIPEDLTHLSEEDINELKTLAKESELSQAHFERYLRKQDKRVGDRLSEYERTKAEIGEDNLTKANDFIAKHYPEELHEHMKEAFISDPKVRNRILQERDKSLNSSIPALASIAPAAGPVTDKDILEARAEIAKAINAVEQSAAERKYLSLIQQQHEQRKKGY